MYGNVVDDIVTARVSLLNHSVIMIMNSLSLRVF